MSDPTQASRSEQDDLSQHPEDPDSGEAALIEEVLRRQEQHREGGIDLELAAADDATSGEPTA